MSDVQPTVEAQPSPSPWPPGVKFRHYVHRDGSRVTVAFRLVSTTETGGAYEVAFSRYNPKHERANYTLKEARRIAVERLQAREERMTARAALGRQGPPADPEAWLFLLDGPRPDQTFATWLINSLVTVGALPARWSACTERQAKRFQNYFWEADLGLVREPNKAA